MKNMCMSSIDIQYLMRFTYFKQLLPFIIEEKYKNIYFRFFCSSTILRLKTLVNNGKKITKFLFQWGGKWLFFITRNFSFLLISTLYIMLMLLGIQTLQLHGRILHKILNYHMLHILLLFLIIQLGILYFPIIKMLVLHLHQL